MPRSRSLPAALLVPVSLLVIAGCASAPQADTAPSTGDPNRPVALFLPGEAEPGCAFDSLGTITVDANSAAGAMDTTAHRQIKERAARMGADAVLVGREGAATSASGRMVAEGGTRRGGRQMGASGRTPPAAARPVSASRVRAVAIRFKDPACGK